MRHAECFVLRMFLPSAPTRIPTGVGPHDVISGGDLLHAHRSRARVRRVRMDGVEHRITVDAEHTHNFTEHPAH